MIARNSTLRAGALVVVVLSLGACCSTLPELDSTGPTVSLRANVDGRDYYAQTPIGSNAITFRHDIRTRADEVFVQWSVVDGGSIRYSSIWAERGSLRVARPSYVTHREISQSTDALVFEGRRDCPKSRLTVGAWVRPQNPYGDWVYLSARAEDWGGSAGAPNYSWTAMIIYFDR